MQVLPGCLIQALASMSRPAASLFDLNPDQGLLWTGWQLPVGLRLLLRLLFWCSGRLHSETLYILGNSLTQNFCAEEVKGDAAVHLCSTTCMKGTASVMTCEQPAAAGQSFSKPYYGYQQIPPTPAPLRVCTYVCVIQLYRLATAVKVTTLKHHPVDS